MRMIELGEATLSPPDVSNFESIVQETHECEFREHVYAAHFGAKSVKWGQYHGFGGKFTWLYAGIQFTKLVENDQHNAIDLKTWC